MPTTPNTDRLPTLPTRGGMQVEKEKEQLKKQTYFLRCNMGGGG